MPFKLGPWEIGLILVIILIVFGVGKLPQIGQALGKSIKSFKQSQKGDDEDDKPKETKELKKDEGDVKKA